MINYLPHRPGGLVIACLCLFISLTATAQKNPQQTKAALAADARISTFSVNERSGLPSSIYFRQDADLKTTDVISTIRRYFYLQDAANDIRPQQTTNTAGITVEKFMLSYKGIPVEHSAYNVVSRNGKIISITAESYSFDAAFSVQPSLTEATALSKALAFVNARQYAWQSLENDMATLGSNDKARQMLGRTRDELLPHGKLVIAKNVYGDGKPRLAWKFDIYATEPLGRYDIYIDAMNGKLLLRNMIIKHAAPEKTPAPSLNTGIPKQKNNFTPNGAPPVSEPGTAYTRYAGIRTIQTTRVQVPVGGMPDPNNASALLSYSGVDPRSTILLPETVFILKDDTRGGGIETYDMNAVGGAPVSLPALHDLSLAFVDRNTLAGSMNVWRHETTAGTNEDHIRGATSNGTIGADEATNDDYALDAHWGAGVVYDYWKNIHGRFSYDNLDGKIKSYVHYGPAYDNAFWNGSVMTYGDGSGTVAAGFKPLTSLDVCGHEIGHGICSFTSDLVYESESGAMNEALSDIWASCIERYAILHIDPSLANAPYSYKPFYIGEQISVDATQPLRRMDDPKASSNPDTYGGRYWSNPVCTPTLANDQCGVHTNSGVLNKCFYLLTIGSGAGSGPDAMAPYQGADDGMRDNGGTYDAIPYSVTGIGYDRSENIFYLMELMLTPNATYTDARTAAINAAKILYGECSAEEQSVWNAFNAVNVGAAWTTCTAPLISVNTLSDILRETAGGQACDRYNEYDISINLTTAQASPVTLNLSVSATTLSADEYSLSASSVTYNTGETGLRTVKLRIYDDAMTEANESISVNINSAAPAFDSTLNYTIEDDDIIPAVGGTATLLSENFESLTDGVYGAPAGPGSWGKIDVITPSPVQWSVRTGPALPFNYSGKRAIIEMPLTAGQALYDQLTAAQTILRTPIINAAGRNSVQVSFIYSAGGEPACSPACDYGQLVFSTDGINFSTLNAPPLYAQVSDAHFSFDLPASFNGKQFYLGLLWNNDANGGTSVSVSIDSFMVTGKGSAIETELHDSATEKLNAETGKISGFFTRADGEIVASITNSTAHHYGCVSASVEKAGLSGFQLYADGPNSHRVADKVIRVSPVTNNTSGQYTITLYYTEAEIAGMESYSGFSRTNMYMYKTSAANYTGANATNTERAPATYTAIPGAGGSFTATFSTGFSGFTIGNLLSVLPVNCISFRAVNTGNAVNLQWVAERETNNSRFEVERSVDGNTFNSIGTVYANAASLGNYSFSDNSIAGIGRAYYRIKQVDNNGRFQYICSIIRVNIKDQGSFELGHIMPNPGTTAASVNIYTDKTMRMKIEYINTMGQLVNTQPVTVPAGYSRVSLQLRGLSAGAYMVRFRDDKGILLDAQTYIQQ